MVLSISHCVDILCFYIRHSASHINSLMASIFSIKFFSASSLEEPLFRRLREAVFVVYLYPTPHLLLFFVLATNPSPVKDFYIFMNQGEYYSLLHFIIHYFLRFILQMALYNFLDPKWPYTQNIIGVYFQTFKG